MEQDTHWLALIPLMVLAAVASFVAALIFIPAVAVAALVGRTKWLDKLFAD
jgi:hypothetical protein